jgi:hypothetical protein
MDMWIITKKDIELELNEIGTPLKDLKSNGGRIPDNAKYGTWLRRNDTVAFYIYCKERGV